MVDTIRQYFEEVGDLSFHSPVEERQLLVEHGRLKRRIRTASDPAVRAALTEEKVQVGHRIAEGYVRFVISKASGRTKNRLLRSELISAGNEGLMIAVEKFDTAYSNRLLTYAAYWVSVKMDEVLHRLGTVHVSVHLRKKSAGSADGPPDPIMTPIDDVPLASSSDVELEARPKGQMAMSYLDRAGLSLRDKLVLTFALGLRGEPRTDEEISMILYAMDGSVVMKKELEAIRMEGLSQLRNWLSQSPDVDPEMDLS